MNYETLFYPEGVVVIGSQAPGKLANVIVNRLIEGGMKNIYAVNPKAQGTGDVKGYSTVQEIGEKVDLAVIASPAFAVAGNLEDCGKAGVKSVAIITSGFSEAGNVQGEKEILEISKKYGIRFIGPNCAGVVNTHANLLATLETRPPKGNIAIMSQSGAVGGTLMAMACKQGLGISKFVSYGNGLDITVIDLLKSLKDDNETKVIALYIETVDNGREFMKVVSELTKVKPVVVVKSGRTSIGQRAALSHTGSMAGADGVFDAALKQCGAIRVETIEDMFDVCKGFSFLSEVKGDNMLIVTNSGGPGVMASDKCEEVGLKLLEPTKELKEDLGSFLPSYAALKNPIDLTVEGTGEEYCQSLVEGLKEYDCALALYIGTPYLKSIEIAKGIVKASKESGKPIVSTLAVGSDIYESLELLKENGIPNFSIGEKAVKVLSYMSQYYKYKNSDTKIAKTFDKVGDLTFDNGSLLEPDAKALLTKCGISVPYNKLCTTREEAVEYCKEVGYPAVMKVVSPQIIHKSDVGGVILNIKNEEEAANAFDKIAKIAEGKDFRGTIVYKMVDFGKEVILGLTRDPQFGPVVAFGLGGIYTEVLKDIVLKVAPVDKETALDMIKSIKTYDLLKGVRGEKGADIDALADTIVTFSQLPFMYPNIEEGDLNPVFVYEKGLTVVDARIIG